ncbi:hypothetical protein ACFOUP_13035 [Belliella kenyensis]|uniref:Uncharacterized protein n=1 Tax=Belliella kenyensis TaxID=1472724 RepID=A0ABV8EMR1_9BACT|nr:hypothetical protein [Belliella kenyensis]MCH7403813.1 hypothetical protein [Belliella kenyensis]MDN3601813.1 hypothetical protein [Belliella kenyensis]
MKFSNNDWVVLKVDKVFPKDGKIPQGTQGQVISGRDIGINEYYRVKFENFPDPKVIEGKYLEKV